MSSGGDEVLTVLFGGDGDVSCEDGVSVVMGMMLVMVSYLSSGDKVVVNVFTVEMVLKSGDDRPLSFLFGSIRKPNTHENNS